MEDESNKLVVVGINQDLEKEYLRLTGVSIILLLY